MRTIKEITALFSNLRLSVQPSRVCFTHYIIESSVSYYLIRRRLTFIQDILSRTDEDVMDNINIRRF